MFWEEGSWCIIGVTVLIFCILFMRKLDFLLRMAARACMGSLLIYGGNTILEFLGFSVLVGLNPVTLSCMAILGIPGLFVLYGVALL